MRHVRRSRDVKKLTQRAPGRGRVAHEKQSFSSEGVGRVDKVWGKKNLGRSALKKLEPDDVGAGFKNRQGKGFGSKLCGRG